MSGAYRSTRNGCRQQAALREKEKYKKSKRGLRSRLIAVDEAQDFQTDDDDNANNDNDDNNFTPSFNLTTGKAYDSSKKRSLGLISDSLPNISSIMAPTQQRHHHHVFLTVQSSEKVDEF